MKTLESITQKLQGHGEDEAPLSDYVLVSDLRAAAIEQIKRDIENYGLVFSIHVRNDGVHEVCWNNDSSIKWTEEHNKPFDLMFLHKALGRTEYIVNFFNLTEKDLEGG